MPQAGFNLQRSASWFTLIGALAALVHYVVALASKGVLAISPSWANIAGFMCAFPVSYFGHRALSFGDRQNRHRHALPRFLLVACLGFAANQALLLTLLRFTHLPFWLVLGLVMVLVAVSSYLLSRHWAFNSR